MESITALQPDLIVLWRTGTGEAAWRKLMELGFTVYRSEPDSMEKIASSVLRLGRLSGTEAIAEVNSLQLLDQIKTLQQEYSGRKKIKVFYQFWDRPVFTVNGRHLISHIIELCGGHNIFSGLSPLTPQINPEAVLELNPEVIIASGEDSARPPWLDNWRHWPELAASSNNHLYSIPPELIQRQTPRIIQGATMMCEYIDKARY